MLRLRTAGLSPLAAGLALVAFAPCAGALEVYRTTAHGYIVIDEPGAQAVYNAHVPDISAAADPSFQDFLADLTAAIAAVPGAPQARFLAVMQTAAEDAVLAYYLPIANTTRGLGIYDEQSASHSQVFDRNFLFNTAYPLTGFVFLNTYQYYTINGFSDFGKYLICTQEFGHRYGAFEHVPPQPAGSVADGGTDGDGGTALPNQPAIALLGRDNAHWSYFMNTGGSPIEGNLWTETSPGTFTTGQASLKFAPIDLYNMGIIPASEVPPFWYIANPDVGTYRDGNRQPLNRASQPEIMGRHVTVTGRRVTYTIDDIIAANGARTPAYHPRDGGAFDPEKDMDVTWVLLTTKSQVSDARASDALAAKFEQALATCTDGYQGAADNRAMLVSQPVPAAQAINLGADGGLEAGVVVDPSADASTSATSDGGPVLPPADAGCGCRAVPGGAAGSNRAQSFGLALGAMALCATVTRRRRNRG